MALTISPRRLPAPLSAVEVTTSVAARAAPDRPKNDAMTATLASAAHRRAPSRRLVCPIDRHEGGRNLVVTKSLGRKLRGNAGDLDASLADWTPAQCARCLRRGFR
ncbi:hypothetical protein BRDID11004_72600 [Bradyrhizobium diazoefficiens]|uniref:Uncharacterized protein n=1 Tax=Bradyrhizobium diazoefficiens TaxID=1355477 RepID=A0A810B6M1_9BRAD|nr:hypothetical protein XF8B_14860 [Bradyrhizobium diazoefficiens]BCF40903.1 hypothetical protein XF16B_13930 [Bradyrhizobium diazoefficiens]